MEGQVLCIALWDVLLQRSSGYVQVGILLLLLLQYCMYTMHSMQMFVYLFVCFLQNWINVANWIMQKLITQNMHYDGTMIIYSVA